jgi:hypothetical protein
MVDGAEETTESVEVAVEETTKAPAEDVVEEAPAADEAPAEEPAAEEPAVEEPAADEPAAEAADEAPAEEETK